MVRDPGVVGKSVRGAAFGQQTEESLLGCCDISVPDTILLEELRTDGKRFAEVIFRNAFERSFAVHVMSSHIRV